MGFYHFLTFNEATIHVPLFIYKIMLLLKHQENEIHQALKEKQFMVCSSPFSKQKCENLKKIRLIVFKCNSLRSNQFMTGDTNQQFWYTGVVLITKLDHYFLVSVSPKTLLGFRNNTKSP